jgi:hypothetical protein
MNSLHQQQPEDNRQDLTGADAIAKTKELVEKAETCFFCTASQAQTLRRRGLDRGAADVSSAGGRGR